LGVVRAAHITSTLKAGVEGDETMTWTREPPDWAALYRAASANLSTTAKERRAREAMAKLERQRREAERKAAIKEEKERLREWTRNTKAELKELTKLCNQYDRKMRAKKGLTAEEHGAPCAGNW
jgi:septin family protein